MKNNRLFFAVLIAVIAVAFAILFAPVSADVKVNGLIGYGVVVTLVTVGFIEYGSGSGYRQLR